MAAACARPLVLHLAIVHRSRALLVAFLALALLAGPAAQSAIVNLASWTPIAGLFFGEYAYRRWRYPEFPHKPPLAAARNLVRRAPEWLRP